MCGIAGIWGEYDRDRLRAMANRLRHRGPDDESFWSDDCAGIAFVHRRLAVIDLDAGAQPIPCEDGHIVTICNGEIYNYVELREELLARGHTLATKSDTEVIVHLYEEMGTEFVSKLRGMFAIAVWDNRLRQLVLVRDRAGKKPLYYSETDAGFVFASQIRGVLAGLTVPPTVDPQAIADFLTWTVIPGPGTIYREVRCLQPGEMIIVRERRIAERRRYWNLAMEPKTAVCRDEAIERIDHRLNESVRLRLRADVPVGCFLSGGIDSGILTAMAARHRSDRVTTITVGFEDGGFDERPLARMVAQRYGTDHHEVALRPDVANDLPRILAAYDQPFGDSSCIPSFYLARTARQHVKVVLNGDGGDELFAGYRRYVAARLSAGAGEPAGWQRWSRLLPTPRSYRSAYAFGHRFVRGMALDDVDRYLAWATDAFEPDVWASVGGKVAPTDRFARESLSRFDGCGALDRMLATDFSVVLPYDLLVKMDIATMIHGLEARSPMLDQVLVDEVAHLPESLKLGGVTTKPLLREMARRYLPEQLCSAPKRGFEMPLVHWLGRDLRDLCQDVLLSRPGLVSQLIDRPTLERLCRGEVDMEPARWARRLWLLLVLGLWDHSVHQVGA